MAKARGKYADVIVGLKPRPADDLTWQAKVDAEKQDTYAGFSTSDLASEYIDMRALKARIEGELSRVNLSLEAVSQMLISTQEEGEGDWGRYGVKDNALRLSSGETLRVQTEPYAKVVDKEAFRQWCVDHGYERQLQLWPTTMNAIVKERLLAGENEPAGTEAYSYSKIVFNAAKEE